MTDASHRAAVAERAARAGGVVAREQFRGDLSVESKANKNDLVTETDRDAQRQVVATIRAEFSRDRFLCEEDLSTLAGPDVDSEPEAVDSIPNSGSVWVIDDRRDGELRPWNASVGDGRQRSCRRRAGRIGDLSPSYGDLYAAGPESVTRDGTELSVSGRTDPETFAVAPVAGGIATIGTSSVGCVALSATASATFGVWVRSRPRWHTLPTGRSKARLHAPDGPWDTLAGVHMVRRAGGTVTDLDGEPWTHDSDSVVASNGEAHEAFVAAGNEALAED